MQDVNWDDRRNAPRIKRPLIIQYGYELKEVGRVFWDATAINDISQTGASFNVGRKLERDEVITLFLTSPTNPFEKIELKAKVINSADSSVGIHMTRIEFVGMEESQRKILVECIAWFLDNKKGE